MGSNTLHSHALFNCVINNSSFADLDHSWIWVFRHSIFLPRMCFRQHMDPNCTGWYHKVFPCNHLDTHTQIRQKSPRVELRVSRIYLYTYIPVSKLSLHVNSCRNIQVVHVDRLNEIIHTLIVKHHFMVCTWHDPPFSQGEMSQMLPPQSSQRLPEHPFWQLLQITAPSWSYYMVNRRRGCNLCLFCT